MEKAEGGRRKAEGGGRKEEGGEAELRRQLRSQTEFGNEG